MTDLAQPQLWDAPADPTYRSTDPEPSKVAGKTVEVNAREAEVVEALRLLIVASDCADIQRVLAEHGLRRERNCISRRLTSLERKDAVRRAGFKQQTGQRQTTLWRLA